jgi:hypothetical protein
MKADWNEIASNGLLYSVMEKQCSSVSSRDVVRIVYGLGQCDAGYCYFPETINRNKIFLSLLQGIEKDFLSKSFSYVIYGLSLMDVSWNELDDEMCLSIGRMSSRIKSNSSSSLEVVYLLYGMIKMSFDHILLRSSFFPSSPSSVALSPPVLSQKKLEHLINIIKHIFHIYLNCSSFQCEDLHEGLAVQLMICHEVLKRFPENVKDSIFQGRCLPTINLPDSVLSSSSSSVLTSSKAHILLFHQLQKDLTRKGNAERKSYSVEREYGGIREGLFSADLVIKEAHKILGFVEVDGDDHHYRFDRKTGKRTLRRNDLLKEFLYRHDYPDIPFIRVYGLNSDVEIDREYRSKSIIAEIFS